MPAATLARHRKCRANSRSDAAGPGAARSGRRATASEPGAVTRITIRADALFWRRWIGKRLIGRIATLLVEWGAGERRDGRAARRRGAGRRAPTRSSRRCASASPPPATTWGYHPFDPICRRTLAPGARRWCCCRAPDSRRAMRSTPRAAHPVFFVANHLSYIDANVIDALLVAGRLRGRGGQADGAGRPEGLRGCPSGGWRACASARSRCRRARAPRRARR